MAQKILILNGSPRKTGNTAQLVEAFTRGAESAGHAVTTFNVDAMDIHPCKGCLRGGKDPASPCSQKDAMEEIYPIYREADIVVLASPLYYDSVTAQLKATFDRLFAVSEGNPGYQTPPKQVALLMVAGDNDFSLVTYWYDHLLDHLAWKDIGQVLCGNVLVLGDIDGRPELMDAENLGRSIG